MSSYYVIGDIKTGGKHRGQNKILKFLGESHGFTQPKVLYVGAACGNLPNAASGFKGGIKKIFPGGTVSSLLLSPEHPNTNFDEKGQCIKTAFEKADIVYFDGGEVPILRDVFDKFSLKELCAEAVDRGRLVGGLCGGGSILASEVVYYDVQMNQFVRELGAGLVKQRSVSCHMDRVDEYEPRYGQLKNAAYGAINKAIGLGVDQAVVFNGKGEYAVLPDTQDSQDGLPFYVESSGHKCPLEAHII